MKAKKSLGQNFLKSKEIVDLIVETADISEKDVVLEIGPGKGVLTEKILEKAGRVVVVEKDDRLIDLLNEKFNQEVEVGKLTIIHGDVLEFDVNKNIKGDYKLVANIPYYITGQIIKQFLTAERQPQNMVLMLQKEVAKRICDSVESILSVSVKVYGKPKYIKTVQAKYFSPQPKVDSAVLLINNISKDLFEKDEKIEEKDFFDLVKAGFAHKRKVLANNLHTDWERAEKVKKSEIEERLEDLGFEKNTRAENLNVDDWKRIFLGCQNWG